MRLHKTLRRRTFAPNDAAKGPNRDRAISAMRRTAGSFEDGTKFQIIDDWSHEDVVHKMLDRPWRGRTEFYEKI